MALRDRSGQTLLIIVFIGLILLISIPVVVYLNQIGSLHQVASQKRTKGRAIAEEGISFATLELSSSTAQWQNALIGNFQAPAATDCNTNLFVPSPSGGQFRLFCSTGTAGNPGLQPYQVAVRAVAYLPDRQGLQTPTRAVLAYLSQRTLGVDLATGVHAAAALQLISTPTFILPMIPYIAPLLGPLVVHWGPVVILSTDTHTLNDPMDQVDNGGGPNKFPGPPRKFSSGGLTGIHGGIYIRAPNTTASDTITDQKEYWAFASQSFPPLIDENYYMQQASATIIPTSPTSEPVTHAAAILFCPGGTQCGYFRPDTAAGDTFILFTGAPYAVAGSTIYVEGNAEFRDIDMDNMAVIVSGNLTLGNPAGGGTTRDLRGPNTANLEYPYWRAGPWPCQNQYTTGTCRMSQPNENPFPTTALQFRGFLYVKGNLIVANPSWNLAGSVLVGDMQTTPPSGQLTINSNCNITVAYDDFINHRIRVNPVAGTSIKVVPDLFQDIPVP